MSNNRNDDPDLSQVVQSPCDLNLLIYFVLSCLLFAVGFKITFFSDVEDEDSIGIRWPWLGPLFLFVGTILAMNTLNYLRNKNMAQMSSEGSDSDLFPEVASEPVEIRTNQTASYQNLPPSYTSALHSDSYRNYMSLPLNETDNRGPGELSSSNQANWPNYNGTGLGANQHANRHANHYTNNPIVDRNALNSFDHGDRQSTDRSQYHPLTVDLPPAYNDIIK